MERANGFLPGCPPGGGEIGGMADEVQKTPVKDKAPSTNGCNGDGKGHPAKAGACQGAEAKPRAG